MDVSFEVDGLDKLHAALPSLQKAVEKELGKGLFASAKKVEAEAKRSIMSGEKTGRVYKRRTVEHRASAPGEAPANDTGRLVNSINSYVSGLTGVVVAGRGTALYARLLEFGTSKIIARPFMFPALERSREWIVERLNKAVRNAAISSLKK